MKHKLLDAFPQGFHLYVITDLYEFIALYWIPPQKGQQKS